MTFLINRNYFPQEFSQGFRNTIPFVDLPNPPTRCGISQAITTAFAYKHLQYWRVARRGRRLPRNLLLANMNCPIMNSALYLDHIILSMLRHNRRGNGERRISDKATGYSASPAESAGESN